MINLRVSGIYEILHLESGKRYIGSANNFHDRFRKHKSSLRNGSHHSVKLQRSWNKYGESAFKFNPLLLCEPVNLLMYEQILIDFYDSYECGFNSTIKASSRLGVKSSLETRMKISIARTGLKLSESHKENIGKGSIGKKHSASSIQKMSDAHKGKKKSDEHIEKMRKVNLGKKLSEDSKLKISKSLIGNDRAKGYKFTEEQKDKMSKSHIGIKQDAEWIAKRIAKRLETINNRKTTL